MPVLTQAIFSTLWHKWLLRLWERTPALLGRQKIATRQLSVEAVSALHLLEFESHTTRKDHLLISIFTTASQTSEQGDRTSRRIEIPECLEPFVRDGFPFMFLTL